MICKINEINTDNVFNYNFGRLPSGVAFGLCFLLIMIVSSPALSQEESVAQTQDATTSQEQITAQEAGASETDTQSFVEQANTIKAVPVIDLSAEMRATLERQFEQIKSLEEQEDAFSENLGEAYLGYGKLLTQVGRLDEAREMYAKSLHLAKINHGVYAIEQRPVLKAMFEMHEAKAESQEMERYLRQLIWLEKKHPDIDDNYSYDLVLKMGNLFIDQYLASPRRTEAGLEKINKGITFMNYAVNRYGDRPLSEVLMPYGELALLYYIRSQVNQELLRSQNESSRFRTQRDKDQFPKFRLADQGATAQGFARLEEYLYKAQNENQLEHQVRALRDIGDLYLLFGNTSLAERHYNKAWLQAAQLSEDNELVKSFENPVKIPDFNYAGERRNLVQGAAKVSVPLSMRISKYGKVRNIVAQQDGSLETKYIQRAKRTLRRFKFRPAIENGKMVATENFSHSTDLILKQSEIEKASQVN